MINRPRRLRKNSLTREMVAETRLAKDMFIYPYFVMPGKKKKDSYPSMPGIHRFTVDELLKDVEKGLKAGVNKLLLFGVGEKKSPDAASLYNKNSIVCQSVKALKKEFGEEVLLITDVCLCSGTDHGHCGIVEDSCVKNDRSVEILAKISLSHAEAGADMVAPSDMMDGRVAAIRNVLDEKGLEETGIMSYATKFSSAYYGPFRDLADSSPKFGDRSTYQQDFRNGREAMKEAMLDENEGADILMVKPALAYLDVITNLRANTLLPIACYSVSGEYAMVKAAAAKDWVDEKRMVMENMYAFARAGADIIITYHTRELLEKKWL